MAWKELTLPIRAMYEANLQAFFDKIDVKMREWQTKMAPFKGANIIAYHNEWVYFETRFGLHIVDFMETQTRYTAITITIGKSDHRDQSE